MKGTFLHQDYLALIAYAKLVERAPDCPPGNPFPRRDLQRMKGEGWLAGTLVKLNENSGFVTILESGSPFLLPSVL